MGLHNPKVSLGFSKNSEGQILKLLASPCFVFCLLRVETEGFLDYQGRAGIISIVRWNLRPVIFRVNKCKLSSLYLAKNQLRLAERGSFRYTVKVQRFERGQTVKN